MSYTAEFSYTTNHYVDLDIEFDTPEKALEFILDKTYGNEPDYKPDKVFLKETLESNSIGDRCDDVGVNVKILEWPHDGDCDPIIRAQHNHTLFGTDHFNIALTHEDIDLVLQVLSEKLGKREQNKSLPYASEAEFYEIKHHTKGHDETDKLKLAFNRLKQRKLENMLNYEPEEAKFFRELFDADERYSEE